MSIKDTADIKELRLRLEALEKKVAALENPTPPAPAVQMQRPTTLGLTKRASG